MNDQLRALLRRLHDEVTEDRIEWERDVESSRGRPPSTDEELAWGEEAVRRRIDQINRELTIAGNDRLGDDHEDWLVEQTRLRVFGFGVLDQLLADPRIENITANGCDFVRVTYAGGEKAIGPPLADSDEDLDEIIRQLAATAGHTERRFDDARPFLDLQLPDGSRLHAVKGVSLRPSLSIRRHRFVRVTLEDLVRLGTIDEGMAHFFSCAVRAPLNMIISGGTDTGKTTFMRALVSQIPAHERLVVIEDNRELQLSADADRDVIELETRDPNVEGAGAIGMAELVRQSLRMRPDRVIVGEIRGGEAAEMFKAMSTGNDGSLSTLHADSSQSAISKMRLYGLMADDSLSMEASAELIAQSIHVVVHLRKLPDGTRVVSSVREITGTADGTSVATNEIYAPDRDLRGEPTGNALTDRTLDRLERVGFDRAALTMPSSFGMVAL